MSTVTENVVESGSDTGMYSEDDFLNLARTYNDAKTKALVNAVSRCDSLDDAIAIVTTAWGMFEHASQEGSGYTPGASLGFGSDSAAVIADKIMGIGNSVSTTRKALSDLGKK